MTRDELERVHRALMQGLDVDRATALRLVKHALGGNPRTHAQGCAWWRGEVCDSECEAAP